MRIGLGFFFSLLIFCHPIHAAEFRISKYADCAIELDGKIESGDLAKLEALAEQTKIANYDPFNMTKSHSICLNSPGGSYEEGRLLSAFIHKHALGTRIRANSKCLSACAFMFMAGRMRGSESDAPYKFLHTLGRLGFHAPYMDLDDNKKFSASEVESIVVVLNKVIADLIGFSEFKSATKATAGKMIESSLLSELLSKSPGEFIEIDTVEKIARWGISIYGHAKRKKLTALNYVQACMNSLAWFEARQSRKVTKKDIQPTDTLGDRISIQKVKLKEESEFKSYYKIEFISIVDKTCLIEENSGEGYLQVCTENGFNGLNFGKCPDSPEFVPDYFVQPPDQKLSSISCGDIDADKESFLLGATC